MLYILLLACSYASWADELLSAACRMEVAVFYSFSELKRRMGWMGGKWGEDS
jgi:hypothetical protein